MDDDQRLYAPVLAAFLALSLLPLGGVTLLLTEQSEGTVEDRVVDHLSSVSTVGSKRVEDYLAQSKERMDLVASRTQMRISLAAYGEDGNRSHLDRVERILRDALQAIDGFQRIRVASMEGELLVSTDPTVEQTNLRDDPLFQAGRDGSRVDLVYFHEGEVPTQHLTQPLLLEGEPIGVLGIDTSLDDLHTIVLDRTGLGETGEILLAEPTGEGGARFIAPLRFEDGAVLRRVVAPSDGDVPVILAVQGEVGPVHHARDYRGEPVITVLQNVDGTDWVLAAKMDRTEAFAPVTQLRNNAIGIGVGLGVVAVAASVVLSRAVTGNVRSARSRIRSITDAAPTGIVTMDSGGRIVSFNPAAERLFGRRAEEVEGTLLTHLTRPSIPEDPEGDLQPHLEAGSLGSLGTHVRLTGTRSDGATFPLEAHLATWKSRDATHYTAILQDITDQVRITDRLELAKETAEEAARAKAAFLANMSHEIRTPLNAVIGMTSLLSDTALDEEQREYVRTVRTSGEHLLTIINDVLDLSKIEAGRLELEDEAFHLRSVVEQALDLVAPQAAAKKLDVAYEMESDVPEGIRGDPGRLRQVLLNLLSNGVKFTHAGEVITTVRVASTDGDDVVLEVRVRDTGVGIPEATQANLLQPFTQADASTTREHGGTGLGLAISRELVDAMGGELSFESTEGEGSTFRFTLPTKREAIPMLNPLKRALPELEGLRVLVVDDNETNRTILQRYLEAWGMEPVLFSDPREALAAAKEGDAFDLALLDYHMPHLDGLDLAVALRDTDGGAELPLLLLTSVMEGLRRARQEGIDLAMTLTKPIKPSTLFDALTDALAVERSGDEDGEEVVAPTDLAEQMPYRILVVEDNEINQRVALGTLGRLGYEADVAADGREAVEMVHQGSYDLVFMDVQMPGVDGYEATRRIREELPEERQPRIVAMTAHAGPEARRASHEAGMDGHLEKPFTREAVVRTLHQAVGVLGDRATLRGGGAGDEAQAGAGTEVRTDAPLLDGERFDRLVDLLDVEGEGGLRELVAAYGTEAPGTLEAIQGAVEAGDAPALRSAAHKLKGTSRTLGAERLAQVAAELEDAAAEGDLEDAGELLAALEALLEPTMEALREAVGG